MAHLRLAPRRRLPRLFVKRPSTLARHARSAASAVAHSTTKARSSGCHARLAFGRPSHAPTRWAAPPAPHVKSFQPGDVRPRSPAMMRQSSPVGPTPLGWPGSHCAAAHGSRVTHRQPPPPSPPPTAAVASRRAPRNGPSIPARGPPRVVVDPARGAAAQHAVHALVLLEGVSREVPAGSWPRARAVSKSRDASGSEYAAYAWPCSWFWEGRAREPARPMRPKRQTRARAAARARAGRRGRARRSSPRARAATRRPARRRPSARRSR